MAAGTGLSPAVGVARTAISSKGVSEVILAWGVRSGSGVEGVSLIGDLFEEGKNSNVEVRISVYSTVSKVKAQELISENVTLQENEDEERESLEDHKNESTSRASPVRVNGRMDHSNVLLSNVPSSCQSLLVFVCGPRDFTTSAMRAIQ
ncbi:hypothetical protein M427DRAFT_155356, partial [Gonapodya prolifera JEL478]